MSQYSRGSEWRRWDLHIHTPMSILNNQFGDNFDEYVLELTRAAKKDNIAVIGITDYFTIDGYSKLMLEYVSSEEKIKELFTSETELICDFKSMVFLPNIEFRLDTITDKDDSLNFHIILSNELSIEDIQSDFLEKITFNYGSEAGSQDIQKTLTRRNIEMFGEKLKKENANFAGTDYFVGIKHLTVNENQILEILNSNPNFRNKFIAVLPCDKELTSLPWGSRSHAIRRNLIAKSHMMFTSNANNIKWALGEKYDNIKDFIDEFKSIKACVHGSDAHEFSKLFKPDGDRYCWIKADPNFKGLKQASIEPDRIFIGDIPKSLTRTQNNKTKTMDSLNVKWIDSYTGNQGEWFRDTYIPLNPEMTVIIGNKGSGKTAIAEIIGLLSNSKNEKDFAFLSAEKFRNKKLSKNFEATLTWHDNVRTISKSLHENVDENADELVHCVPQNSFEKFCNDNSEDGFISEINSVVFSQMKKEDKLDFSTFDELIRNEKAAIGARKKDIGIAIHGLNEEIKLLEVKRDLDHKKSLVSTKSTSELELEEHIKNKPLAVEPPKDLVTAEYTNSVSALQAVEAEIETTQEKLEISTKHRSNISLIKENFENLEISVKEKMQAISIDLEKYELDASKILKYSLDLSSINLLYTEYDKQVNFLKGLLIQTVSTDSAKQPSIESEGLTLKDKKVILEMQIAKFNSENEGKLTQYQKYLTDSTSWEGKNKELLEKIAGLQKQIDYIGDCKDSDLVVEINRLKTRRIEKVKLLYKCMTDERAIYDKFKKPIVELIDEYQMNLGDFKAEINTGIYSQEDFVNTFVDKYISNNVNGPFKGPDGVKKIREYFLQYDFSTEEGLLSFITDIESEFEQADETKCYHGMFKKNMYDAFVSDFYNLTYLDARYSLQLFGKELHALSPGERGSLLLVFYLLLDARDIPLILDQPEDNLDNESVAKILVPFIKEAKTRRQIIIVTHNSNLAVVSDAEQVIRVKIDKLKNYKFSYESGSLESEIIKDVVDVLEGTINSFNIRKDKYLN